MVCHQLHSLSHLYWSSTRVSKTGFQNSCLCHIPVPLLYPSVHQSPFYVERLYVVSLHIIDRYHFPPTRLLALYLNRPFHKPHESSTSPLSLPLNPKSLCPQTPALQNPQPRPSHHATSKQATAHFPPPRTSYPTIKASTTPPSYYPPSLPAPPP